MPDDQKVDEVLRIVREEREKNTARFDEVLGIVRSERALNNTRFVQLSASLQDLREEMKSGMNNLDKKIDHLHSSLSEDIQALAEDHSTLKRRVDKIERKIA